MGLVADEVAERKVRHGDVNEWLMVRSRGGGSLMVWMDKGGVVQIYPLYV